MRSTPVPRAAMLRCTLSTLPAQLRAPLPQRSRPLAQTVTALKPEVLAALPTLMLLPPMLLTLLPGRTPPGQR